MPFASCYETECHFLDDAGFGGCPNSADTIGAPQGSFAAKRDGDAVTFTWKKPEETPDASPLKGYYMAAMERPPVDATPSAERVGVHLTNLQYPPSFIWYTPGRFAAEGLLPLLQWRRLQLLQVMKCTEAARADAANSCGNTSNPSGLMGELHKLNQTVLLALAGGARQAHHFHNGADKYAGRQNQRDLRLRDAVHQRGRCLFQALCGASCYRAALSN